MTNKDPFAGPGWRDTLTDRGKRLGRRSWRLLLLVLTIALTALVVFLILDKNPRKLLEKRSAEFVAAWPSIEFEDLVKEFVFRENRRPFRWTASPAFRSRGWNDVRPGIRLVSSAFAPHSNRVCHIWYSLEGLPEDQRLKVIWRRDGSKWTIFEIRLPEPR